MEGEITIGLWRLPPGRNENQAHESEEDQEPVRPGHLNQESDEW